jgi:hypothetical protein
MFPQSMRPLCALTAAALAFAVPQAVPAQTSQHVVSPFELQSAGQQATDARRQNIETLKGFLSSTEAQQALDKAHINPVEVQTAIVGLNDQDLAQLSARATKAQNEFSAGMMSNEDLLIILIAVAVLILIIVAVK